MHLKAKSIVIHFFDGSAYEHKTEILKRISRGKSPTPNGIRAHDLAIKKNSPCHSVTTYNSCPEGKFQNIIKKWKTTVIKISLIYFHSADKLYEWKKFFSDDVNFIWLNY